MKKTVLKAISISFVLIMLFGTTFSLSVAAAEKTTASGLTYTEKGSEAVITGYSGSAEGVVIPDKIGSLKVTRIDAEAFKDCKLKYISIPVTIEKIGKDAFKGCYTLKTVDIKDIGAWCEIEFANEYACPTIMTYAELCFEGVAIKSLYIPDGTTKIGAYAFYGNHSIEKVFIPQSVKSIGEMAFRSAYKIKDVYCISTDETWEAMTSKVPMFLRDAADVWLINPKETATDGLKYTEENGKITITGYEGNLYKLQIPAEIDGKPVVKIAENAFNRKDTLAEVIIPDTVKDIFYGAFLDCKYLVKVNIPEGVKVIQESTFENCNNLGNIDFPKSLQEIDIHAFGSCHGITKINVPQGATAIKGSAFENCINLKEINLPDTIISVSYSSFMNTAYCNDESNWQGNALYAGKCLLKVNEAIKGKLTVCEGTKVIGSYACYECPELTEVVLPESVVSIGSSSFYKCEKLKKINIPEGVTEIPYNAFNWCSSLESVYLPSTVQEIGDGAFNWCNALKEINIPDGVTKISSGAFELCAMESIVLPESVTKIEDHAFRNCKNLKDITIGSNVTEIYETAFSDTAYYNDKANWDGDALYLGNCLLVVETKEKTYEIKDGTTTLGGNTFRNCHKLESITIPESVENICNNLLIGANSVKEINFGGSELQWNRLIEGYEDDISGGIKVNFAKESEYILGDVTIDGRLNVRDATLIQKFMAKIETLEGKALELADFNNDGKINVKDATAIQKHIAGMPY